MEEGSRKEATKQIRERHDVAKVVRYTRSCIRADFMHTMKEDRVALNNSDGTGDIQIGIEAG